MTLSITKIKEKLWTSAEFLRGSLNPEDNLNVILRILVLKRLSDQFGNNSASSRFNIPEKAEWDSLLLEKNDIKYQLEKTFQIIEEKNIYFRGILFTPSFQSNFSRIEINALKKLFEYFNNPEFNLANDNLESPFIIGDAFRDFIDYVLSEKGIKGGDFYTPNDILQLIIELVNPNEGMSICDPACGSGGFLIESFRYLKKKKKNTKDLKIFGQEINFETYSLVKLNLFINNIYDSRIEFGDIIKDPKLVDHEKKLLKFDIILADPPWMLKNWGRELFINGDSYNRTKYGLPPSNSADWMWIQHIIATLEDKGRAGILLHKGILSRQNEKSIREGIIRDDLIEGVIELPSNMFYISSLPACILIINKDKAITLKKKIYFLKIESDKKKRRNKNTISTENLHNIINLYIEKKVKNFVSALIDIKKIEDHNFNLNPILYINDLSEIAKKRGLKPLKLSDVVIEINQLSPLDIQEFQPKLNSFYLPLRGSTPACKSLDDLRLNPDNYVQIVLKPEEISSEYVCGFFNNDLGHRTREQISGGSGTQRIYKNNLLNSKIFIPKIQIQKEILDVVSKIQEFSVQLEEFEKKLWTFPASVNQIKKEVSKYKRGESFEDWIECLPFPLASILWRYHSDLELIKKLEHLLNFFEATAVFFGTIMLSALDTNKDLLNEFKEKIFLDKEGHIMNLEKSYFGKWVIIDKRLANIFRKLINEDFEKCRDLFKINSRELLNFFFDKRLYNILDMCSLYRNKWKGHTGITSDTIIHDRLVLSQKELTSLRKIIGDKFNDILFFLPESDLKIIEGILNQNVQILMGSRLISKRERIQTLKPLDTRLIYMLQKNSPNPLELKPFFQIMPSPKEEKIACYFYNSIEDDGVQWKSFHFKDPAELTEPNEQLKNFIAILEK